MYPTYVKWAEFFAGVSRVCRRCQGSGAAAERAKHQQVTFEGVSLLMLILNAHPLQSWGRFRSTIS